MAGSVSMILFPISVLPPRSWLPLSRISHRQSTEFPLLPTIRRPENTIDDVVPEVTLNILDKTEKTAKISVKPDVESAKDALITFVGKYNQAIGQINILSQNKPELIDEMDYLTDEEKKAQREKLGMFLSDSSLNTLKSNVQAITQARYPFNENAEITMLSQIGIATNRKMANIRCLLLI